MSNLSPFYQLINPLTVALKMMPRSGRLLMLGLAVVVSSLLLVVFDDALENLEERVGELGWTLFPITQTEQRITLVAIDEKSIAQIGAWPWPREQMARLTTALNDAGVQLQLHDIVYSEPNTGDAELLAALESSQGAVLAQVPALQSDQTVRAGVMTHPLSGVSCNNVQNSTSSFIAAHGGFAGIPKGHIAPIISSDGSIRRLPAIICVDDEPYPALALTALLQVSESNDWGVSLRPGEKLFGPHQLLQLDAYPGLEIPLDANGNLRISYRNAPQSYRAVSAVDVMTGGIDREMLEDTWVLVGATAFGIGDIVPTPYSGATPGIEIQARILGSLLDLTIPYTPQASAWLLGLMTLVFAGVLFGLAGARDRVAAYGLPTAGVLFPIAALSIHVQLLVGSEIWLGWLFPALFSVFAASLLLLLEQSRLRSERSRVFSNLNSYLPSDVAKEIAYSLPSSSINARRCEMTLLSADLRNFAAFGEARPPEEAAAVLHFFFVRATEIVESHGGRIHEFKGDGLLAVWDGQNTAAAKQAMLAAQEMQQQSIDHKLFPQKPPPGLEPLALGIGIEQGPALIGSIGPANRRSHTLLGDTVSITLRIQEMTADLAQPILIGECAARQLSDFRLESQGSYLLSGLRIPHCLFAPPASEASTRKASDALRLKVIDGGLQ